VDDEPQIRRVMRAALVTEGYEVADARSGDNALDRLHSKKYDLILLDINMPGLTGIQICLQIRLVSDGSIFMMTVRDLECDKVAALDMGADDYVTKPFSMPKCCRGSVRRCEERCTPRPPESAPCALAMLRSIFEHGT
jgi:DNA-binding response OmpR family regulator